MSTLTRAEAYDKYSDELVRFATGLAGPDDGADLVSSAMVNVLSMANWEQVHHPRAYLYQAVLNEGRRHYRTSMRRRAGELRSAGPSTPAGIPDVRPDVLEAVGGLSIRQRAVVFLAYWEDLRPSDIARRLGIGESTVHRHLRRAEDRLRRVLDV